MPTLYQELAAIANRAKARAHAPYSRFRVGAAVLTKNGEVFTGCNIENSSYSLTICAERTAIFKAISEGKGKDGFKAIAIASDDPRHTPPCGACRQVLIDLAGNIDVILVNPAMKLKTMKLKSLMPMAFTDKNLKRVRRKR